MAVLIGLTGSIGMGKSTTAAMFAARGVPVWDADAAVHRLYAPDGAAVQGIGALFPDAIVAGGVSRDRLKAHIAANPAALRQIEQVVHPLVAADRARFIEVTPAPVLLLDIPLLFETGSDAEMDLVVVVSTSAAEQEARVMARPGMTAQRFRAILEAQLPDAEKRARADVVIDTTTMETAAAGVDKVLRMVEKDRHA